MICVEKNDLDIETVCVGSWRCLRFCKYGLQLKDGEGVDNEKFFKEYVRHGDVRINKICKLHKKSVLKEIEKL